MMFQKDFPFIKFQYWISCYLYNNRYLLWLKRKHPKHFGLNPTFTLNSMFSLLYKRLRLTPVVLVYYRFSL